MYQCEKCTNNNNGWCVKLKINGLKKKGIEDCALFEEKEKVEVADNSDYKERFKEEFWQLAIRLEKLNATLFNWEHGTLTFEPTCSRETLENQVVFMRGYLSILKIRAKIENINLN